MYWNLYQKQWYTQNLVDACNADEALWKELEIRRKLRRRVCSLSEEEHEALDLLEFEAMRPPDDCIGIPIVYLDERKMKKISALRAEYDEEQNYEVY
jgi:hypothetical protein